MDYFLARYYSAAQGRFTSPDEFKGGPIDPFTGKQIQQPGPLPYADITNPQSLNKYTYGLNNPLRYIDPDGHDPEAAEADTILDIAIEEVDAVVRPLINSAYEGAASGGRLAIRGVGTALAVPFLLLTTPQELGDADEMRFVREQQQRRQQYEQQQNQKSKQPGTVNPAPPDAQNASHKKGARPSTQEKHEAGQARKKKDRGGEKGDERRRPPRKRPDGWKGPWPPKEGQDWY